jgi:hypothetical protein
MLVIPAKAGIQSIYIWIPVFTGMTDEEYLNSNFNFWLLLKRLNQNQSPYSIFYNLYIVIERFFHYRNH